MGNNFEQVEKLALETEEFRTLLSNAFVLRTARKIIIFIFICVLHWKLQSHVLCDLFLLTISFANVFFPFGATDFFSSGFSTQHRKYTQKKKSSTNFFPEYLVFVLSCNTEYSIPYTRVSQAFGIQTKTFLFVSLFAPEIKLKQTKNNNNSDRNERVYRNYDTDKKVGRQKCCVCVPWLVPFQG